MVAYEDIPSRISLFNFIALVITITILAKHDLGLGPSNIRIKKSPPQTTTVAVCNP